MHVNADLIHFILTAVLSFIMGLELKTYRIQSHPDGVKIYYY